MAARKVAQEKPTRRSAGHAPVEPFPGV